MTVKTLAYISGKPLIGVNGLNALAAEYAGLTDTLVARFCPAEPESSTQTCST